MTKQALIEQVVQGGREFSVGTVLFHQAVARALDVNVSDMKCLDVISMRRGTTPSELAAHTGLTTGATTAMIDRLEHAGLIERRRNPADRRSTIIALSRHAKEVLPRHFASLAQAMTRLVSCYRPSELAVLADFFARAESLWREERQKLDARLTRRSHRRQ